MDLSCVAHFDEFMKVVEENFEDDDLDEHFLEFAENQELCRLEWLKAVQECRRLQAELDNANHELGDYSNKLVHARRLLDQEKKQRRKAEQRVHLLEQQMVLARDLLFNEKCQSRIPEDTKQKLSFLNNSSRVEAGSLDRNIPPSGIRLNTIAEVNSNDFNSTGSLISDFSYSRSEDDLDVSRTVKQKWKKYSSAPIEDSAPPKKRRSSSQKVVEIKGNEKIVATTTLSVSKEGPVTATSIIEAVPQIPEDHPVPENVEKHWLKENIPPASKPPSSVKRQHTFASKAVIRPDTCDACHERIRFGKIVLKCKDCRGICHTDCKDKLPLPCVMLVDTPTQKGVIGTIADYTPKLPPMVPAILVHCLNEIELRGLTEVGIYRVPGSEKEVKMLKQKFLRSKSSPPLLNTVEIHVICGVVKDFLRSLQEPLVTIALWKEFVQAVDADSIPFLYQAISQLPQPNRDTLAYMILHLLKVAESKHCKMPVSNLAKVFGPTIVGYSSQEPDHQTLLRETRQQAMVMEHLLRIPVDFWASYVNVESTMTTPRSNVILQTPSTASLSQPIKRGYFTPSGPNFRSVHSTQKKRRFFGTPPHK